MKFGMRWQSVSTWMVRLALSPSLSRSWISRSKKASQSLLRARLSSVMKKALIPCARFSRMIASRSSAVRKRLLRPCTLMIVQKEHWNGQPRPRSKLDHCPAIARDRLLGQQRQRARRRCSAGPSDNRRSASARRRRRRAAPRRAGLPRIRRRRSRCPDPAPPGSPAGSPSASTGSPRRGSRRSTTGRPAARNGRARSSARWNWLDWTPTRPISAFDPRFADIADDPLGDDMVVGLVDR